MTTTMTQQALSSVSIPATATEVGAVSGVPLTLLRLEGAAALATASVVYAGLSGRWLVFASLFLLPDLSMLGYLVGRRVGAACYNAGHSYAGPAVLAGFGTVLGLHALVCVACIWVAHIGFDRLLGYGLKYGTSFGDTHLGRRGRAPAALTAEPSPQVSAPE
jgi:Domain of unknown function (DUF4260)